MIDQDGDYVGSVSGGCLEADLLRKVRWLVRAGASMVRYSTEFEDTDEIPFGSGCGGTLDLLLEPAGTREFELLMTVLEGSLQGESAEVITILPEGTRQCARFVVGASGLRPKLSEDMYFRERIEAPPRVFVLGAGDDARPLVKFAALLGWRVIVLDGRQHWAKASRFPGAERVLNVDFLEMPDLDIGERDFVVLMSHSYSQDQAWLRFFLPRRPCYLALLGAKSRSGKILTETSTALGLSFQEVAQRVAIPAGLDLGGDGPVCIALSIVSEMQACLNKRSMRLRPFSPQATKAQEEEQKGHWT